MPKLIDITGQRFGRLTVMRLSHADHDKWWWCKCDCGCELAIRTTSLLTGRSQSCGCSRKDMLVRHGCARTGKNRTSIYSIWSGMVQRCTNPKHPRFKDYGGRGIEVRVSFEAFYAHMGDPPPGKSIDRIDNDGHYEIGNMRWATRKEQAANQRIRKNAKLTPEQVLAIRLDARRPLRIIAADYGIGIAMVSMIVHGKRRTASGNGSGPSEN